MSKTKNEKELDLILNHNSTTVLVYTKDGYYEALFDGFLYLLENAEKHKLIPEYPDEWWEKLCEMYPAQTFFLKDIKK